jgi:hypothetical protein
MTTYITYNKTTTIYTIHDIFESKPSAENTEKGIPPKTMAQKLQATVTARAGS